MGNNDLTNGSYYPINGIVCLYSLMISSAVQLGLIPIATLVAVRRWASAESSPLHEQARADRVGESLGPGGAPQGVKSEVARGDGSAPEARSVERTSVKAR